MNRKSKAIIDALNYMQEDPMTTRKVVRLFADTVALIEELETDLAAAEYALQQAQDAPSFEILEADKGPVLSTEGVPDVPKKRGRPSKNTPSVHDEDFGKNSVQRF